MKKIRNFLSMLFRKKQTNINLVKKIAETVSTIFSITPVVKRGVASPYIYTIENNGEEEQAAILFGYAKFANEPNYGSGKDIVITPEHGISYFQSIFTIALNPFDALAMRLLCSNKDFFENVVIAHSQDINGRTFLDPIPPIIFKSKYQSCEEITDIIYPVNMGCNDFIKFVVPPKTKFVFTIYPSVIYKQRGKEVYETPVLSGIITINSNKK